MLRIRATRLGSLCVCLSCDPRRRGAMQRGRLRRLTKRVTGLGGSLYARIGLSERPARGAALYSGRA